MFASINQTLSRPSLRDTVEAKAGMSSVCSPFLVKSGEVIIQQIKNFKLFWDNMKPAKHLPKFCLAPSSLIRNYAGQKLFSISPAFLAHENVLETFLHSLVFKQKPFISVIKMVKLRVTLIMKLQNNKFST